MTAEQPRCQERNKDGRRCDLHRHHPRYCAALVAGRWVEWFPAVSS